MDEIAPEYDVVVLGTGKSFLRIPLRSHSKECIAGLTECVLSGSVERLVVPLATVADCAKGYEREGEESSPHR